ncbi:PH domain-containing protein [Streptomyces millisiae]|uniref:PH domain-containing protein n=1 Tax=Streptomyces millisiae TaxID=3075542 RepID=A0ABU2LH08_9ACTN|nr:PH domain-containing protein [Streptomyces sp. DSM 44918]MDT0316760.1 PH domain-containing protein [Streptomyces sp. DSM 44918]
MTSETTTGRTQPLPLPTLPVTYRPVLTRLVLLTIGSVVLGVLSLIAVVLPEGLTATGTLSDRLTLAGCGVAVFGLTALLSRPKVTADAEGLTVVNLTTRRRLAWAQVVRVTLRPGDPWVSLDLADGTVLAVMAIQPGVSKQRALADARALRALAEAHGTASAEADGTAGR